MNAEGKRLRFYDGNKLDTILEQALGPNKNCLSCKMQVHLRMCVYVFFLMVA